MASTTLKFVALYCPRSCITSKALRSWICPYPCFSVLEHRSLRRMSGGAKYESRSETNSRSELRSGRLVCEASKLDRQFVENCDKVESWVVFSDLHVAARSLATCLEVLQKVRTEAESRNAGVLFLGDFWHHRGVLPVEPLNSIISEIRQWSMPTIMLTGNHDQVDLSGMSHSLTPIEAACPCVRVLDTPTVFLNALWLPYRRDGRVIETAMDQMINKDVQALFVHADVVGGLMNDSCLATEGIHPDAFPNHIPVYSGHYHKPHVVKGTPIQYVGSPYQVSRSESGQTKELFILDKSWKIETRVGIDVAPRHFQMNGINAEIPIDVRKGDRIRWCISADDEKSASKIEKKLRKKGLFVEIVSMPTDQAPRIEKAEHLGPLQLFTLYGENQGLCKNATNKGLEILKSLEGSEISLNGEPTTVQFSKVQVEGFGPFQDVVEYSLDHSGIRVICGRNEDDDSSESNGAGKSFLVTAPLWAITGRMVVRGEASGRGPTNADIINDGCKSARVRLEGSANGQVFCVEREVRRRGKSQLTFLMDGKDLTKADAKLTQQEIDKMVGAETLAVAAFYGHGNVTSLLQANDREFKTELGRIVDLAIWESARDVTFNLLKENKGKLERESLALELHSTTLSTYIEQLQECEEKAVVWKKNREMKRAMIQTKIGETARSFQNHLREVQNLSKALKNWLNNAENEFPSAAANSTTMESENIPQNIQNNAKFEVGSARSFSTVASAQGNFESVSGSGLSSVFGNFNQGNFGVQEEEMPPEITSLSKEVEKLKIQLEKENVAAARLKGILQASKRRFASYAALKSGKEDQSDLHCDQCLQPIDGKMFDENIRKIQGEVDNDQDLVQNAEKTVDELSSVLDSKSNSLSQQLQDWRSTIQNERRKQREAELAEQARILEERKLEERKLMELHAQHDAELNRIRQQESQMASVKGSIQQLDNVEVKLKLKVGDIVKEALEDATVEGMHGMDGIDGDVDVLLKKVGFVVLCAEESGESLCEAIRERDSITTEKNPYQGEAKRLLKLKSSQEKVVQETKTQTMALNAEVDILSKLDVAFNRSGIPGFVLEGVLGELQQRASRFLEQLSPGMTLSLSATTPGTKVDAIEKINKEIHVRSPGGSTYTRSMRQLSSGELRRLALALTLGYSELVAERGRLRTNLIVLDEVLGQLDREGCSRAVDLLESLPQKSVLVVGQAGSFATQALDDIDWVVKENGVSTFQTSQMP